MKSLKILLLVHVLLSALAACGGDNSGYGVIRTVVSVECNDGTLIYVTTEDCSSVTCEGHGGVKQSPCP